MPIYNSHTHLRRTSLDKREIVRGNPYLFNVIKRSLRFCYKLKFSNFQNKRINSNTTTHETGIRLLVLNIQTPRCFFFWQVIGSDNRNAASLGNFRSNFTTHNPFRNLVLKFLYCWRIRWNFVSQDGSMSVATYSQLRWRCYFWCHEKLSMVYLVIF